VVLQELQSGLKWLIWYLNLIPDMLRLIQFIKARPEIAAIWYQIQDLFRKKTLGRSFDQLSPYWQERIHKVCAAEINQQIARHKDAGRIINGYQVMHNGLKIRIGSYYGYGESFDATHLMLEMNKGVHEPEEEFYFHEVLKQIPDGAVMIELGAYWSYYSMWFNSTIRGAQNYMIEPDARSLYSGKKNFSLNGLKGKFFQYFIASASTAETIPSTISVDDFIEKQGLSKVHVLHCDIQGYELQMLMGAASSLRKKLFDYIFISTHSAELHFDCIKLLTEAGYHIHKEIDLDKISSFDGLIVASSN
jgi:hypothetical protein